MLVGMSLFSMVLNFFLFRILVVFEESMAWFQLVARESLISKKGGY